MESAVDARMIASVCRLVSFLEMLAEHDRDAVIFMDNFSLNFYI